MLLVNRLYLGSLLQDLQRVILFASNNISLTYSKVMRKQGKTFREISDAMTNSTRKKFPVSWVFKILTRQENEELLKVA